MLYTIFEVFPYFILPVLVFAVLKSYNRKFLDANDKLRHNEFSIGRAMTCDVLDYKRYLSACVFWEAAFLVSVCFSSTKLMTILS